jgi:hypothetical protein
MGEEQEDLAPRIELIFDYERDLVAWARQQAQFLQQRRFDVLDLDHLIEEVEAIGTVYRDRLQIAMQGLLVYWLKLTYATGHRLHEAFWRRGAASRQRYIEESLVRYPSLTSDLDGLYSRVYPRALRDAEHQLGDFDEPHEPFPESCPWAFDELLDPNAWPGG